MKLLLIAVGVGCHLTAAANSVLADDPADGADSFASATAPFLTSYCLDCHGHDQPEAGLTLQRHSAPATNIDDVDVWHKVLGMVERGLMPPPDETQPTPEEVSAFAERIRLELDKFDCTDRVYPGRVTIRRLNRAEYNNTVRDLLGIDFQPADDFPSDDVGAGFDNIGDVLSVSPILIEKYLAAAAEIVKRALADPPARSRILVCDPAKAEGEDVEACYRKIVRTFASRAFRRPATDAELDRLLRFGRAAFEQGASADEALSLALQAILASPHFLFRVELAAEVKGSDSVQPLSDFELASRLSYFLWSSMPDAQLIGLARAGKLHRPEVLREQVTRMLADSKSEALVQNFAGQWLQLRDLANLTPDRDLFPDFDEPLRTAMRNETELLFRSIVREDHSVLTFLDADYSFLNERLARHYGIAGVQGDDFRRVTLNDQRRGLLAHGSILLLTSNPTRTSPVKRGKWILENLLDDPPPPPLPGVMELDDQAELVGALRERMEQHRADPNCAVCHRTMDALGFGLENFDAVGAWRDRDGRFPINGSGTLPGDLSFRGPRQLIQALTEHNKEDFCRCLAKKMLTYALGRELQPFDRCAIDIAVKELAAGDYKFSALVTAIVTSIPFTKRGT